MFNLVQKKQLHYGPQGTIYAGTLNDDPVIIKHTKRDTLEPARAFNLVAARHAARFVHLAWSGTIYKPKPAAVLVYAPALRYTLAQVKHTMSTATRKAVFLHLYKTLEIMHGAGWVHNDIHPGNIMCQVITQPSSYMLIDYQNATRQATQQATQQDFISLAWALMRSPLFDTLAATDSIAPLRKSTAYVRQHTGYKGDGDVLLMRCAVGNYPIYARAIGASPALLKKYPTVDPLAAWLAEQVL
jgi:hypothetical protein